MSGFKHFNLSSEILRGIEEIGYLEPTKVQSNAIPVMLSRVDLVMKSSTGSGKTAAYGIPLCELSQLESEGPTALILVPTRELAYQTSKVLMAIGRHKQLKALPLVGQMSFEEQKLLLSQRNHFIVGTPGRVLDHMQRGTLKTDSINFLVIDEADEMLSKGFLEDVENISSKLPNIENKVLLSATMPARILDLIVSLMNEYEYIEQEEKDEIPSEIQRKAFICKGSRLACLDSLLISEVPLHSIIFCQMKESTQQVYEFLSGKGYSTCMLHGDMPQKERLYNTRLFSERKRRILVATDVASRGLDIEDLSHVISYEVPEKYERLVHRSGRTGRMGKEGTSIVMVGSLRELEAIGAPSHEVMAPSNSKDSSMLMSAPQARKESPSKGDILTIYIGGGKDKKIRNMDILGTILSIDGIEKQDVGIITVMPGYSTVDIHCGKGEKVIAELASKKIKGKKLKIEIWKGDKI